MECVDRSLRDLLNNDHVFGGIPILWSGDWQQTLPIVVRGAPHQVLANCFQSCYLYKDLVLLTLTKNMRIELRSGSPEDIESAKRFAAFLGHVGQGTAPLHPEHGENVIKIPQEYVSQASTLDAFINEIYPDLSRNAGDKK